MADDDFDDEDREPWLGEEETEDRYADEAAATLEAFINANPQQVFFERQLQVRFEKQYYHWITSRVLNELAQEKLIRSEWLAMNVRGAPSTRIRFFFSTRLRYWRRRAKDVLKIVATYSQVEFTKALGCQAEMLFDAALPKEGFIPVAQNAREYGGRRWEETGHDLDRIFVRDGVAYGAEIKNKLAYIEGKEFLIKLRMCRYLGLRPLFICRMLPKSYIYKVYGEGGYGMVFRHQLYPFGSEALGRTVRETLGLPVDCPTAIWSGTITRFLRWHLRNAVRIEK